MTRRIWMDNLRWLVIVLVVLFHVACMFNSCQMPLGVGPGIPALDTVGYITYPWMMPLMFLLAGMSARFALNTRPAGVFIRERARRLLLPLLLTLIFIAPLLCGFTWWMAGTSFAQMAQVLPVPVVALIALLAGMGPQWFLLFLFLCSALLLPLVRLDRGGRFLALCGRAGWLALFCLGLVFWLGSLALPGPDRYALYFLTFLMGYWVFSQDQVLKKLKKGRLPLLAAALVCFVVALARYWGISFSDPSFLVDPVTALFAWLTCLGALGGAQAWLTGARPFLHQRGFSLYLFHYLPMLVAAYFTTQWGLAPGAKYLLTLAAAVGVPLLLHEVLTRIPPLGKGFGLSSSAIPPTQG